MRSRSSGGLVDKFIGDGIMALFGLAGGPAAAARAALAATRGMALALNALNRELAVELDEPLRMGMGVHLGPVILGEMGHGPAASLTAIGDTVNVASRLEALTKELGCQLVVSEAVTQRAGSRPRRAPSGKRLTCAAVPGAWRSAWSLTPRPCLSNPGGPIGQPSVAPRAGRPWRGCGDNGRDRDRAALRF